MVSSWSVETNNVEDDSTLNEVIGFFYTDNKNRKR